MDILAVMLEDVGSIMAACLLQPFHKMEQVLHALTRGGEETLKMTDFFSLEF